VGKRTIKVKGKWGRHNGVARYGWGGWGSVVGCGAVRKGMCVRVGVAVSGCSVWRVCGSVGHAVVGAAWGRKCKRRGRQVKGKRGGGQIKVCVCAATKGCVAV